MGWTLLLNLMLGSTRRRARSNSVGVTLLKHYNHFMSLLSVALWKSNKRRYRKSLEAPIAVPLRIVLIHNDVHYRQILLWPLAHRFVVMADDDTKGGQVGNIPSVYSYTKCGGQDPVFGHNGSCTTIRPSSRVIEIDSSQLRKLMRGDWLSVQDSSCLSLHSCLLYYGPVSFGDWVKSICFWRFSCRANHDN